MSGSLTRAELAHQLRELGLTAGDDVLVHASMRSVGLISGGADVMAQALLDVVGPEGTLVAPATTAGNSDPGRWGATRGRAVPEDQWEALRASMPPFDPATTPSEGVGILAETIRRWPGAQRSGHPQASFAAIGVRADDVLSGHEAGPHYDARSPVGKLALSSARVLLLGVGWDTCTCFHVAEYHQPAPPIRDYECVVLQDGIRCWFPFRAVQLDSADFGALGADFEATGAVVRSRVGQGVARLCSLPQAVEFAVEWMRSHREPARG